MARASRAELAARAERNDGTEEAHRDPDRGRRQPRAQRRHPRRRKGRDRSPRHAARGLPRRIPRARRRSVHDAGIEEAVRDPHDRGNDPGNEPGQAASDARRRCGRGHDRRGRPQLREAPAGRAGVPRRRGHGQERAASGRRPASTSSPCPRPSTTTSSGRTHASASTTALGVATEAIDRLHSTAHSHHRIIVVEIMGHGAGWLALGAGIAGGADVILIPEIPYYGRGGGRGRPAPGPQRVQLQHRGHRRGRSERRGRRRLRCRAATQEGGPGRARARSGRGRAWPRSKLRTPATRSGVASKLEELTGLESRVTILGYVQRGGTPSAGRPAAGDPARQRRCGSDRRGRLRRHGGLARRRRGTGAARRGRRQTAARPHRTPVGPDRASRGRLPRGRVALGGDRGGCSSQARNTARATRIVPKRVVGARVRERKS